MSSQLQKSGLEILHKMQISDKEEPQASEEVIFGQNSGGVFVIQNAVQLFNC